MEIIKALVEGGKANAGPPLGPLLANFKLNIGEVVSEINEKTKEFSEMQVPVEISINTETKEYSISVGTPPVSTLIKKELNLKKLAKAPWGTYTPKEGEEVEEFDANITFDQIVKIAKAKADSLGKDMKKAVKQVVGSCVSIGVKIEDKHPKEILEEINSGNWDEKLK